jgi:competence protein ComEC
LRYPWVVISLAFALGIVCAPLDHQQQRNLATGMVLTTSAALGAALWKRRAVALAFAVSAFAIAGAALQSAAMDPGAADHLGRLEESGALLSEKLLELGGVIGRHPDRRPDALNLVLDVESIAQGGRVTGASGSVLVRIKLSTEWTDRELPFRTGDRVRLLTELRRPDPPGNPGGFDYPAFLRRQGITHIGAVKSPLALEIEARGLGFPGASAISSLRAALERQIRKFFSEEGVPTQRGALLAAMLIGNREMISPDTERLLRRCGLLHIVAISGYHVWVLTLICFLLLRVAGVPDRWASLATIIIIACYWTVSGGRSSAGRACLVGIIFLLGRVFYKRPNTINSLAFAAFVLLVAVPTELYAAGFQLTFAAAFCIALLYGPLVRLLRRLGRIAPVPAVSLAAQMGVLPLTAFYFKTITLHSFITTTLLVPAVSLIIILGFLFLMIAAVFPPAAQAAAWVISTILEMTLNAARLFDVILPFWIRIPPPHLWLVAVYFAALALWLTAERTKLKDRLPAMPYGLQALLPVIPVLAAAALLVTNPFVSPSKGESRFHAIDVGQGESLLLELPEGSAILIDGGGIPESEFDVGENIVSEYLWSRGYRKLEAVVSTHAHTDHLEGLRSVVENFQVGELWIGDAEQESKELDELLGVAESRGITVKRFRRGDRATMGSSSWSFLNPPDPPYEGKNALNRNSLVARVEIGDRSLLLTADIDALTATDLVELYGTMLRSDVLKVPHHGGRDSLTREFLTAVAPQVAVISLGRRNIFHFPDEGLIRLLEEAGVTALRTDVNGALVLRLGNDEISAATAFDHAR